MLGFVHLSLQYVPAREKERPTKQSSKRIGSLGGVIDTFPFKNLSPVKVKPPSPHPMRHLTKSPICVSWHLPSRSTCFGRTAKAGMQNCPTWSIQVNIQAFAANSELQHFTKWSLWDFASWCPLKPENDPHPGLVIHLGKRGCSSSQHLQLCHVLLCFSNLRATNLPPKDGIWVYHIHQLLLSLGNVRELVGYRMTGSPKIKVLVLAVQGANIAGRFVALEREGRLSADFELFCRLGLSRLTLFLVYHMCSSSSFLRLRETCSCAWSFCFPCLVRMHVVTAQGEAPQHPWLHFYLQHVILSRRLRPHELEAIGEAHEAGQALLGLQSKSQSRLSLASQWQLQQVLYHYNIFRYEADYAMLVELTAPYLLFFVVPAIQLAPFPSTFPLHDTGPSPMLCLACCQPTGPYAAKPQTQRNRG